MSEDRKAKWKKEIDLLLSVTDYIVEFVPSQQKAKDGTNMEVNSLSLCVFKFYHILVLKQEPDFADNGDATKKRSAHEYPSPAQA